MTTPFDEGHDPEGHGHGERRARGSASGGEASPVDLDAYPEFLEFGDTERVARIDDAAAPPAPGAEQGPDAIVGRGAGRRRRVVEPRPDDEAASNPGAGTGPDAGSDFGTGYGESGRGEPGAAGFPPATGEPVYQQPHPQSAPGAFQPPAGGRARRRSAPAGAAVPVPAPVDAVPADPAYPQYSEPTGFPASAAYSSPVADPDHRTSLAGAHPHSADPGSVPSAPESIPDSTNPYSATTDLGLPRRSRSAAAQTPGTRRSVVAPPPAPKPALVPTVAAQGPGRRRAKRTFVSYLWPFQAFTGARTPGSTRIRSRSTAATVWRRLKADRLALAGGVTIAVLVALAVFAPLISSLFGIDPTTPHYNLTDTTFGPHGTFGGMSLDHPLGVDQALGRDVLSRLLYGARVSLLVASASTLLSVGIGATLGLVAGYLGGRTDAIITRIMDLFLAFPLLLFALGLSGALTDTAFGLTGNSLRIAVMIFVMGFFSWPYLARIVRAEVLSLREREFVDAARQLGAGPGWVIGRELLPNLMSPILVYATLVIPANIIFEAGLSELGVGLNPPAASWGQMLLDASATVNTDPAYLIVPGMAVFITVLAFNLFGDGLRDALDPTAQ
jgi:ABC-type dipeptide/oligopeptide/nickel transport system permease subunit